MLLYIILTVVLLLALYVATTDCGENINLRRKQKYVFSRTFYKWTFVALLFLFWFLTAFRDSTIGNDTSVYLFYYKQIATQGIDETLSMELGYQYFCLLLSNISSNPQLLLIVCSTVCYVLCGIYIYKYSSNILYSTILLFCMAFPFFASGLRQAIAMVIVLAAYEMIKKQKKMLPVLLIFLAASFHISAMLALLWFGHKFVPKKPVVIIVSAMLVAVLSATGILNTLLTAILQEYQGYFESENAGSGWLGISYYCLRALVFYLFLFIAYKDTIKKNSLPVFNSILLLITVCLGFSVNLFSRASLYYLLVVAIDIPNAFNSGKIKNRNFWMAVMGVIMLAYFIVTLIIRPEWNNLYPYHFYWE